MTFHNYKKPINVNQDLIFVKIYFRDIYFCGRQFSCFIWIFLDMIKFQYFPTDFILLLANKYTLKLTNW